MESQTFVQSLDEKIVAKQKLVSEALAARRFNDRMEFFRSLTHDMRIGMQQFSGEVIGLVTNPMFGCATKEDLSVIEGVLMDFSSVLHFSALQLYLKVSRNFVLANIFVDSMLELQPSLNEELAFDDPRVQKIKLALSSVETLCPERKQKFARLIQEMFPLLPKGKDDLGLYGLVNRLAYPPATENRLATLPSPPLPIVTLERVLVKRKTVSDTPRPRPTLPQTVFAGPEEVAKISQHPGPRFEEKKKVGTLPPGAQAPGLSAMESAFSKSDLFQSLEELSIQ